MKKKDVKFNIPPEEEKKIREAIDNLKAMKDLLIEINDTVNLIHKAGLLSSEDLQSCLKLRPKNFPPMA